LSGVRYLDEDAGMRERGRASRLRVVGALLGLVGGALIVVGTLSPWIQSQGVSVGAAAVPGDVRGIDMSLGFLAAASGAVAVILALVVLLTLRRAARLLGAGLIIASLVTGAVVLVRAADSDQAYIDFAIAQANDVGEPTEGVDESLHELIQSSAFDMELGWGLWLTAGGAVLALVGGCLVLLTGARPVPTRAETLNQPAPPQPGPGSATG
jgi:Tryptophan-associated transmembrane protein (Trp_oprn_chp)